MVGLDVSHFLSVVLHVVTRDDTQEVLAFEFRWDATFGSAGLLVFTIFDEALGYHGLMGLLRIKSSLLHDNVESGCVLFGDLDTGLRHVLINDCGEDLLIS